jgi:mRNA interferase RelE/StbE
MARYELKFRASVAKDLCGLPKTDLLRILGQIESLRDNPRPSGSVKLSSQERYRVRQGNDRILCIVMDKEVVVEIVKVGHRRDVHSQESSSKRPFAATGPPKASAGCGDP